VSGVWHGGGAHGHASYAALWLGIAVAVAVGLFLWEGTGVALAQTLESAVQFGSIDPNYPDQSYPLSLATDGDAIYLGGQMVNFANPPRSHDSSCWIGRFAPNGARLWEQPLAVAGAPAEAAPAPRARKRRRAR